MLGFPGQCNLFHGVQIKPFLDGDIRHMRTIKAAADKERFVFVRFEHFYGFGGDLAIGLFLVRAPRLHPAKREVRIVDYVDRDVPVLWRMFQKRLRGYRSLGYARGEAPLGLGAPDDQVVEYDEEVLRSLIERDTLR